MKNPKPCTAIFDIGKTNKKFYLFDEDYHVLREEMVNIREIEDDDGFPAEDLKSVVKWIRKTLKETVKDKKIRIRALNFTTYGASLVHLGENGKPVAPLYNYLKQLPDELEDKFQESHGSMEKVALQTASPWLGMLNAGLQLFFLKYYKPQLYEKAKWSLFFPQYLSYLFTDVQVSDYTSLGCHTMLWDYKKKDYHDWVYLEGLHHNLPPVVPSWSNLTRKIGGAKMRVGVGLHDSSAALYPYLSSQTQPFSLLSTGTWSIAMNPTNKGSLTIEALDSDCLLFMQPDGSTVMASRLFLGKEYESLSDKIRHHFKLDKLKKRDQSFDKKSLRKIEKEGAFQFRFDLIEPLPHQPPSNKIDHLKTPKFALHQAIWELVQAQIEKYRLIDNDDSIRRIFIDGGFARNEIFTKMLAQQLAEHKIFTARSTLGSAIGAAAVLSNKSMGKKMFKNCFKIRSV